MLGHLLMEYFKDKKNYEIFGLIDEQFSFNKNVKILPTLQKSSILHRINIIESSKMFNKFRIPSQICFV